MNMQICAAAWVPEGEDDEEDCVEDGMHRVQVPQTAADQALQTF